MLVDKIINTAYSFGAAVVVFGAWAKIEYKPYSSIALTAGLMVETAIFCIYGILEWRKVHVTEVPAQEPVALDRSVPASIHSSAGPEVSELTATMKQTNQILHKVFRQAEA
jgi:hypothetical protein